MVVPTRILTGLADDNIALYENIFVKQSDLNEQLEKYKSPQNNFEDLYDRIAKIEESLNKI